MVQEEENQKIIKTMETMLKEKLIFDEKRRKEELERLKREAWERGALEVEARNAEIRKQRLARQKLEVIIEAREREKR